MTLLTLAANRAATQPLARTKRVVLLGAGTVGQSLATLSAQRGDFELTQVLVRDAARQRTGIRPDLQTSNPDTIDFDSADVVVEAIGGIELPLQLARRSLNAGVPYVTANKTLIAACGDELDALARANGTTLSYEAAVGAAIPCIRILREALRGVTISRVYGVLNGTSHYVLSEWLQPGASFNSVLASARAAGFAEADPSADLSGSDAAQKLSIINWLLSGSLLRDNQIERVALPTLRHQTLTALASAGFAVKPLACLSWRADGSPDAWVAPAAVPAGTPVASLRGPASSLVIETLEAGSLLLSGPGAGGAPTASALYDDVLDALDQRERGPFSRRSLPQLARGSADTPRSWVLHVPAGVEVTPRDVTALLRAEGGNLQSFRALGRDGYVAAVNQLVWRAGLFDSLLAKGVCVLEVVV